MPTELQCADRPLAVQVRDLPALPAVVERLIACLGRDDTGAAQIAQQLAQDQALAAKALRLANSPFYGLTRQVGSITEAATILGLRALRSMVIAAGVMQAMPRLERAGFDPRAFWRHALATALTARTLAPLAGQDAELAFTAGLPHDIGRLAMVVTCPEQHDRVAARQAADDLPWVAAEQAVGGPAHAELGGQIAAHWHFLPAIADAVHWHHRPGALTRGAEAPASLTDLVHAADAVAHALDLAGDPDERVPVLDPDAWARLRATPTQCHEAFARIRRDMAAVCSVLMGPAAAPSPEETFR